MEAINHILKFKHIARYDFCQKTIFSCDAIRFDDLRRVDKHLRHSFYFARHGAQSDVGCDAKAEDFGIDQNRISLDSARIFQLVNTLGYAGAG